MDAWQKVLICMIFHTCQAMAIIMNSVITCWTCRKCSSQSPYDELFSSHIHKKSPSKSDFTL